MFSSSSSVHPASSKHTARQIQSLLQSWLSARLSSEALAWLNATILGLGQTHQEFSEQAFLIAFSSLSRRVGKQDLALTNAELAQANALCAGWYPKAWSMEQAARSLLLLALPQAEAGSLNKLLENLYPTASIAEAVALHQTLPLLPHGDRYQYWALEGLRSHITAVFNAVALWNPYPARHFDEAAWNQLVLKAIFVGSPLQPIWGLDERANPELARMLIDYVHERWAAHREVTPELWRLVAPHIDQAALPDLARALQTSNELQRHAVGLACVQSTNPSALDLLESYPDLSRFVRSGNLTWELVYRNQLQVSTV
jgi:hypothetical protein